MKISDGFREYLSDNDIDEKDVVPTWQDYAYLCWAWFLVIAVTVMIFVLVGQTFGIGTLFHQIGFGVAIWSGMLINIAQNHEAIIAKSKASEIIKERYRKEM